MAFFNDAHTGRANMNDIVAAWSAQTRDALAKRRVYKTTVRELSALSNNELADMGIYRGSIKGIALEAAYGK